MTEIRKEFESLQLHQELFAKAGLETSSFKTLHGCPDIVQNGDSDFDENVAAIVASQKGQGENIGIVYLPTDELQLHEKLFKDTISASPSSPDLNKRKTFEGLHIKSAPFLIDKTPDNTSWQESSLDSHLTDIRPPLAPPQPFFVGTGNPPLFQVIGSGGTRPLWKDAPSSTCIHHARLGEHTVQLWIKSHMTDIVVRVKDRCFLAHKAVLTCYCPFFQKNLLAPGRLEVQDVELQNVSANAFEILLSYMYTGRLQLTCNNLGDVFRASRLLQMKDITHICAQILSGKIGGVVSGLYLYVTAKKLNIGHACQRAFRVITSRFMEVTESIEFMLLEACYICEILSADTIGTHSEIPIFMAALKWIDYDFYNREKHVVQVLSCVRFSLMSPEELLACFHPPMLPGIMEIPGVVHMLLGAACYSAAKMVGKQDCFRKYQQRTRKYLLEGETMLWDDTKYNPYYHSPAEITYATVKVQAWYRGLRVRREVKQMKASYFQAAVKIQSSYRGFQVRRALNKSLMLKGPDQLWLDPKIIQQITNPTSNLYLNNIDDWFEIGGPRSKSPDFYRATDQPLLYVAGGLDPLRTDDMSVGTAVHVYFPTEDKWEQSGKMPVPRHHHSLVLLNHMLYVIGGCDPRDSISGELAPTRTCFQYNLDVHKWSRMSDLVQGRVYNGTVVASGCIYVLGGKDESGRILNSMERYCPQTNQWQLLDQPMPTARMGIAVCALNDRIWIAGGIIKSPDNTRILVVKDFDCFDSAIGAWSPPRERLPGPRSFASLVECGGLLHLLGGTTLSFMPHVPQLMSDHAVFSYDPATNSWSHTAPSLPHPQHSFAAITIDKSIYVVGGLVTQRGVALDHTHRWQPGEKEWKRCHAFPSSVSGMGAVLLPSLSVAP